YGRLPKPRRGRRYCTLAEVWMETCESAILLIGSASQENFEPLLSEHNVADLCGQALTNHRGRPRGSRMWVVCYFRKYTLTALAASRGAFSSIPMLSSFGSAFVS